LVGFLDGFTLRLELFEVDSILYNRLLLENSAIFFEALDDKLGSGELDPQLLGSFSQLLSLLQNFSN
jgi:hypothetical protein